MRGMKQSERRKQALQLEAKWEPKLERGDYNNTPLRDSVLRIKKILIDKRNKKD